MAAIRGAKGRTTSVLFGLMATLAAAVALAQESPLLVADFEGADYGEWTVEGDAFGSGPAGGTLPGQMDVSGYKGEGLVSSFHGGDGSTGRLLSPSFTIQRPYISFLAGGGGYEKETCVNLLIDGETVRTATGPNIRPGGSERLEWHSWDVAELQGQEAVIEIVDQRTGGWGHINVDHIIQTSESLQAEDLPDHERTLTATKRYLNLPVKNDATMRRMEVRHDGELVRYLDIELAAEGPPDYWAVMGLEAFRGEELVVKVEQRPLDPPDLLSVLEQGDSIKDADNLYREKYRPQFHFSTKRGWTNDPNGLVYYDGEYHLFYQHNPVGWGWGNMHWGHAVSTDLVHWRELGDAVHPDHLGTIFSGSAVVDWDNTSGFAPEGEEPIVCFYTSAGRFAPEPKPYTQSIAYSLDGGRTVTPYEDNPVIGHLVDGNRDPKVIWHEPSQRWVMALYFDESNFGLFVSDNLKEWEEIQRLELPGTHECPDLFPLAVAGDPGRIKWVFWGASGSYLLGDFDGEKFTPQGSAQRLYTGGNAYAAQTWSDIPEEDGRRIQIAWLRQDLPDMPFNQLMTFPVELTLRESGGGVSLFAEPVEELERLHASTKQWSDLHVEPGENPLDAISGDLFHIEASFRPGDAESVTFNIRGELLVYDAAKNELSFKSHSATLLPADDGLVHLELLVDRASFEIFGNHGAVYIPAGVLFDTDNTGLDLEATGGTVAIDSLAVHNLESIWNK